MINNLFFLYFWILKRAIPFKIAPKKNFLHCVIWNVTSLFYWIHYFYNFLDHFVYSFLKKVSILILLDTLLLPGKSEHYNVIRDMFQSLFYWIHYFYSLSKGSWGSIPIKFQSLFYWIHYFYPYFQENPLFISATEIFSDIKIEILGVIFIIFCYFFSIFRNSKYVFLLVLRGFFSTFLFPVVVGIFSTNLFYHTFLIFQSFF